MLIDPFARKITYLRVSVTDHCNYRCFYCRDEYHLNKTSRKELLCYEEMARVIRLFSELGVSKVRLTGGEPLLRRGISDFIKMLSAIPGLTDIPLSTNAHLLAKMAKEIKTAGINRLNISLDSLQAERFKNITRGGDLHRVIQGIDAAVEAGISPIKLNVVVMRGINEDEIEGIIDFALSRQISVRFIETMPIGASGIEATQAHYAEKAMLERIHNHLSARLTPIKPEQTAGPAKNFLVDNGPTAVGTISAFSNNFCAACNRVRLTAKGRLILCLGQENSISLRDALRSGLDDDKIKNLIIKAIVQKPEKHEFETDIYNIANRQMVEIGG